MADNIEGNLECIIEHAKKTVRFLAGHSSLPAPENLGFNITDEAIGVPHYKDNALVFSPDVVVQYEILYDRASREAPVSECKNKRTRRWERGRQKFVNWCRAAMRSECTADAGSSGKSCFPGDGEYQKGWLGGLVMQMHSNSALSYQFSPLSLIEREESAPYSFWSALAQGYSGLVTVQRDMPEGAGLAQRRAQLIRDEIRRKPIDSAGFIGLEYAAQAYLAHGDSKLKEILTMGSVREIHALIKQPNEDLAFAASHWEKES